MCCKLCQEDEMRALIASRKGLFELSRSSVDDAWQLDLIGFIADPVSFALHDARDGSLYAALKLGHFGTKLHRRDAGSSTWTEIAVPVYPAQEPEIEGDVEWKLSQIWCLAAGGLDQPGLLWAGTLPGGLFLSLIHI
jgi:hypothetical protein